MKKLLLVLLVFSATLFSKEVTVSILPQKYFVEKIAGDKITVNVMVRKGFSPATYEPKTSQMRKLSKSIIYFSIGAPFEKVWLQKFANTNKNLKIVDTAAGIQRIEMAEHNHEEAEEKHDEHESHHEAHDDHDEHGKDESHEKHEDHDDHDSHDEVKEKHSDHEDEHDEHKHEGLDPHIWVDPVLVKIQANNIYKALVKIDAKNSAYYKKNYEAFIQELDTLYIELKQILAPVKDKAFMVFHPSWGYFAKRFDLEQIAVEVQGKEPKPSQLVELISEAKEHKIKIVFVAPQFSQKSAKQIARSINGKTVIMNHLVYDWAKNLKFTATQIADSYK